MYSKPFTLTDGLEVQAEQLKYWKTILKKKYYNKLNAYVDAQNAKLVEGIEADTNMTFIGYSVTRGSDLDNFVANILR